MLTSLDMMLTARAMTAGLDVTVQLGPVNSDAYSAMTGKGKYFINIPSAAAYYDSALSMLRGYLDHEVGHVLFTDFNDLRLKTPPQGRIVSNALWQAVCNIFEDLRIERLVAKWYPGSYDNLKELCHAVFAEAMPSSMARSGRMSMTDYMSVLLDAATGFVLRKGRELLYHDSYKSGASFERRLNLLLQKNTPHPAEWLDQLNVLVERGVKAETTDDMFQTASDFIDLVFGLISDSIDTAVNDPQNSSLDTDEMQRDAELSAADALRALQADKQLKDRGDSSHASPAAKKALQDAESTLMAEANYALNHRAVDAVIHKQSTLLNKAFEAEALADEDIDRDMAANCELANELVDLHVMPERAPLRDTTYSPHTLNCVAAQLRSVLSATLEAVAYKRASFGYYGRSIETTKLYRTRLGDGRVYRRRSERIDLATDVMLLLDTSGSMDGKGVVHAGAAASALGMALQTIPQVRSAAYAYDSVNIAPMWNWGERVPERYKYACNGSTPTGAAIIQAMTTFPKQNDTHTRRMIIIMTDGMPDSMATFEAAWKYAEANGFEVYICSVGCWSGVRSLATSRGVCICDKLEELPAALMATLRAAITSDRRVR